ncbi:hypothetical protein ACFL37_01255 [Candidatus Margulisiibacteriota bacterium]
MILSKNKVKMKCECGQIVSDGSVFCPYCRSEIQKNNDKVIRKEEDRYQKSVGGRRKGKKKKRKKKKKKK